MNNVSKLIILVTIILAGCSELDYEGKEFYKQEVYIISSEATAASERQIFDIDAYTYVDTVKVLNKDFDVDTIRSLDDTTYESIFKIGIGGSLNAHEDLVVKVGWDTELLDDYNVIKNTNVVVMPKELWSCNQPYDEETGIFTITIPKGTSVQALKFDIIIKRETKDDYKNYAFPLKIEEVAGVEKNRLYNNYILGNFTISERLYIDFSGFKVPSVPCGRYISARLVGNAGENMIDGIPEKYKYITKLGDEENLKGRYMIWGTAIWSWAQFAYHGSGWMYNKLNLLEEHGAIYEMLPVLDGDPDFPVRTFNIRGTQGVASDNVYDPFTKTLTLTYKNVLGGDDYVDILTYVDDNFEVRVGAQAHGAKSWLQLREKGWRYWVPGDDDIE